MEVSESENNVAHCLDCAEWQRYVFNFSDQGKVDCHCAYLTKDDKGDGVGEHSDMLKLENTVKKRCLALLENEENQGHNFWKHEFLKIIIEFENAENGLLMPKRRLKKKDTFDIPKLDDRTLHPDNEVSKISFGTSKEQ